MTMLAEKCQHCFRLRDRCTPQALDTICSLALALGPDFAVFFPAIQKVCKVCGNRTISKGGSHGCDDRTAAAAVQEPAAFAAQHLNPEWDPCCLQLLSTAYAPRIIRHKASTAA